MKLGIGSFTYPLNVQEGQVSHFRLLQLATEMGAETVQYCENLSLTELSEEKFSRLKEKALETGIQLEIGTRGLNPNRLREHARMARKLDCGFVRLVIHDPGSPMGLEEAERILLGLLPEFEGIVIAIENHDHFPAIALRDMVKRLGSDRVGVTLDTANSLGCLEGTREVVKVLGSLTRCVHIKDVVATRIPSMLGFTISGATAGQGSVDIPWVLDHLTSACESAILEQWTPANPGPEGWLQGEISSARTSFSYLKELLNRKEENWTGEAVAI